MGYSPWGGKELGTTERLTVFTFSVCLGKNPWKKKDSELPLQGMRVQSLIREVPHAGQCGQKEKKNSYSLLILTSS